jgi:hypothetical protein
MILSISRLLLDTIYCEEHYLKTLFQQLYFLFKPSKPLPEYFAHSHQLLFLEKGQVHGERGQNQVPLCVWHRWQTREEKTSATVMGGSCCCAF